MIILFSLTMTVVFISSGGGGKLHIAELKPDLSGIKEGERLFIENASAPSGDNVGLPAEGSQLFKVNGKYYLFNIFGRKEECVQWLFTALII